MLDEPAPAPPIPDSVEHISVEVGFISNPDESKRLRDAGYQDRIVESLARAIEMYLVDWRRLQAPAEKR